MLAPYMMECNCVYEGRYDVYALKINCAVYSVCLCVSASI